MFCEVMHQLYAVRCCVEGRLLCEVIVWSSGSNTTVSARWPMSWHRTSVCSTQLVRLSTDVILCKLLCLIFSNRLIGWNETLNTKSLSLTYTALFYLISTDVLAAFLELNSAVCEMSPRTAVVYFLYNNAVFVVLCTFSCLYVSSMCFCSCFSYLHFKRLMSLSVLCAFVTLWWSLITYFNYLLTFFSQPIIKVDSLTIKALL